MNKLKTTQFLTSSVVLATAVTLPFFQISAVSAQYGSPISAPISAPESVPSPIPSAHPISAPVTSPIESPLPSSAPVDTNPGSSSNSNNSGGSNVPDICSAEKPKSAPVFVSWEAIGNNQVRLHWNKTPQANYYAVNYGLKSHNPLYGNPNVGDNTSTVIGGLSGGTTYYFSIAAGKDCVHSDNSNEIAIKINGVKLNTPVYGFAQKSVLSATKSMQTKVTQNKQNINTDKVKTETAIQPKATNSSILGNITNFFGNFFRH